MSTSSPLHFGRDHADASEVGRSAHPGGDAARWQALSQLAGAPAADMDASSAVDSVLTLLTEQLPIVHAGVSWSDRDGEHQRHIGDPAVPPVWSMVLYDDSDAAMGNLAATGRPEAPFATGDEDYLRAVGGVLRTVLCRLRDRRELRWQQSHDSLTGLLNRVGLEACLHPAGPRSTTSDETTALLHLGLDSFSSINDRMGHACGDRLIVQAASRLREAVGELGELARLSGDEFIVVLRASPSQMQAVAARVHMAFGEPFPVDGSRVFLGVTSGLALADGETWDATTLMRQAATALWWAKRHRRGLWETFGSKMHAAGVRQRALESDLRRALTESELRVAYQPVVELMTRRPVAVEALVRWEHPELGLLQPVTFLEIAEEAGLDVELGSQVLLRALADIRTLADAGWDLRVNVNVSARQLLTPGFASEVGIALYESGLPGSSLGLEVTETAEVQQSPALIRTLAELKSLEITLLLDDFGSGYSSFSYIKQMPLDALKLDRTCTQGLPASRADTAIVSAMVRLARGMGLKTVGEGVETPEQEAALSAIGCDQGQGYLYSPPLPPGQVLEWLTDQQERPVRAATRRRAAGTPAGVGASRRADRSRA